MYYIVLRSAYNIFTTIIISAPPYPPIPLKKNEFFLCSESNSKFMFTV